MKSYLQGLITGAVFVFAFMVLKGSTEPPPPPQYSNCCDEDRIISRILFCIDGGSVGGESISTYCNN
jgi:hypothetical protein